MEQAQAHAMLRRAIQSLADVPDQLIDRLIAISSLAHYKKGQTMLMAGEVPSDVGFNLNGVFRLYYIDQNGNDLTKGFSTAGKFVISYSALVQHRPSFFSIEALVDTDIVRYNYDQWMQLAAEDIRWYPFLYKLVETVYVMKEMRERSFLLNSATERYLAFQHEYPDLEDRIRLYHIASFIGITPEALSRIRRQLAQAAQREHTK
jgi:CRP-like cAMP-binding protein